MGLAGVIRFAPKSNSSCFMIRKFNIAGVLILAVLGSPAMAQSFSAGLVTIGASGGQAGELGKVRVAGSKVRIDTLAPQGDFFVLDTIAKSAYLVRPGQHLFMDAMQSSLWTQLLVPVDPVDPCAQWQVMAKIAGAAQNGGEWRCTRLGEEMLVGLTAIKYRLVSPGGTESTGWIDPHLKFLIKFRADDGTGIDMVSTEEGPQAESLFAIPAHYSKFDPKQLIERIKQSDVWVEPPK